MKKTISFLLIFVLTIGIVGCSKKDTNTSLSDLKEMPEFSLKDMNDKDVTNEIFKDKKLTMINIWATG